MFFPNDQAGAWESFQAFFDKIANTTMKSQEVANKKREPLWFPPLSQVSPNVNQFTMPSYRNMPIPGAAPMTGMQGHAPLPPGSYAAEVKALVQGYKDSR